MLTTIEVKTRVAATSLDSSDTISATDTVFCDVIDATLKKYVLTEHTSKLIHELFVFHIDVASYISASETVTLYNILVRCPTDPRTSCLYALKGTVAAIAGCAHDGGQNILSHVIGYCKERTKSILHFWNIIFLYVKNCRPFPMIKFFKHEAQSFNSNKKAGLDNATQLRAIQLSLASHFRWEQKIESQIIKTCLYWLVYVRAPCLAAIRGDFSIYM